MAKLKTIINEVGSAVFFCGALVAAAVVPVQATDNAAEFLCSECAFPDSASEVYTYEREYAPQMSDESLKEQTYEGFAPLDAEYYWTMVTGVSERLTNMSEYALDHYVWFLDEVVDTSTQYGNADLFTLADQGMYGITGITLTRAEDTLAWLEKNHPDVHARIMGMMTEEYPGLEGNLIANIPFNLAVTLEAIWLACPLIPEKFDDTAVRAQMYSEIIRGGGEDPYYSFLDAFDRRYNVDGESAGEDWAVLDDVIAKGE